MGSSMVVACNIEVGYCHTGGMPMSVHMLCQFDRSSRPPTLTDVGASAVLRAKEVLALMDTFRSGLTDGDALQGRLQIGAVGSTLSLPLRNRARHPGRPS